MIDKFIYYAKNDSLKPKTSAIVTVGQQPQKLNSPASIPSTAGFLEKELLYEGVEDATSVNIKEFSPQGAKLDITVAGKISGKIAGQILSTHNILMKPGGTSELELKSIIFSNGEPIFAWGKATGRIVDPTPIGKIEGNLTFQTPSQKMGYLNSTKGWSEATYNMATGEYAFRVYAVK